MLVALTIVGLVIAYSVVALVVTWLWATYYLPLHPKDSCSRIGCRVGYDYLYNQGDALESCVKSKSLFWGILWPIGILVFGLNMASHGGLNKYLEREKELKAKAEEVKKLEKERQEEQERIQKIVLELRAESVAKSRGEDISDPEVWISKFSEMENKHLGR